MKFSLKNRFIRLPLIILAIIGIIYLYKYYNLGRFANREELEVFLKSFGAWIPFAYLLIFNTAMFFNIPASVFLIVIGIILGPLWGSIIGIIGCYLASFLLFFISRKTNFSEGIKNKMGDKWESFNSSIEEKGLWYLTIVRSTSVFPFSLICYASGITSIKTSDFIKGTIVGCLPQIVIYSCGMPMFISKNFSYSSFTILSSWAILWAILFFYIYKDSTILEKEMKR